MRFSGIVVYNLSVFHSIVESSYADKLRNSVSVNGVTCSRGVSCIRNKSVETINGWLSEISNKAVVSPSAYIQKILLSIINIYSKYSLIEFNGYFEKCLVCYTVDQPSR